VADKRRGRGEDAVYYEHHTGSERRDSRYHRSCSGRWRGKIALGWSGNGRRIRKRVTGRNKGDVYALDGLALGPVAGCVQPVAELQ
jgi:hypothetical protein